MESVSKKIENRFNELVKNRLEARKFYANNWAYKYVDSDEDEDDYIIACVVRKIGKWLFDTAEKKYVGEGEWEEYFKENAFIPVSNYSFDRVIIAGELGYDFGRDKRIIMRD